MIGKLSKLSIGRNLMWLAKPLVESKYHKQRKVSERKGLRLTGFCLNVGKFAVFALFV